MVCGDVPVAIVSCHGMVMGGNDQCVAQRSSKPCFGYQLPSHSDSSWETNGKPTCQLSQQLFGMFTLNPWAVRHPGDRVDSCCKSLSDDGSA